MPLLHSEVKMKKEDNIPKEEIKKIKVKVYLPEEDLKKLEQEWKDLSDLPIKNKKK